MPALTLIDISEKAGHRHIETDDVVIHVMTWGKSSAYDALIDLIANHPSRLGPEPERYHRIRALAIAATYAKERSS